MIVIVYLVFAAIFAFITAGMATRRGRSGGLWGILGFFFGIFAMILLMIIGNASPAVSVAGGQQFIPAYGTSKLDEIAKLKTLLDTGVLTQAEFDTQKRKLLG